MPGKPSLWTEVTRSEFDHERAALHFIKERFPTREPFRAWANFTFIAEDGTRNEVDLLVASPTGVYLVEIKSYPGRIDGDAGTWVWTSPEGRRKTIDNPLLLAERKAKKLKSLLMKQPSCRDRRDPGEGFYLRSVVFLSDRDLAVGLNDLGRTDVYGPDPDTERDEQRNTLPGLLQLFAKVDPRRGRRVDRPLSAAIAEAVEAAGIRESTTHRKVGSYDLGELLDEGEGWQDFATVHPQSRTTHRRIRIYLVGQALSEEERGALRRAAEREFKFLQPIEHPGIDTPLELLQTPRGPALLFKRDPEAQRLDHWLADNAETLEPADRIELVRELAEALRHAHRAGLYHRALTPNSAMVSRRGGRPRVRLRDWQAAKREGTSTTTASTGTLHVADRVAQQAHIYLAPETRSIANPMAGPADIWSLGAVSFLILTGNPPAPDIDELNDRLRRQGHLTLTTAMESPPGDIDQIIRTATLVDASDRFVSVDEFLGFLDLASRDDEAPEAADPLDAKSGDMIGDRWLVERRVGSGRTSVVFLAMADDRTEILKVARSDEDARRLRDEFKTLEALRDRSIVAPYGLEAVGGRTILRLEPALITLAEELRQNGSLSLDLLQRFGLDLLRALAHLDNEGVAHRDIKPDNIGIAERGKDNERHLVLFDFSLSNADPAEIQVGTTGYLDPFLPDRDPPRWDDQAERYAVAVTLYEMATGTRPDWGDGSTDPRLTDLDTPSIDSVLFDPAVREPLLEFFETGLHRDPGMRFDTVHDMHRAWEQVFGGVEGCDESTEAVAAADVDLSTMTEDTPLAEFRLAARVRNALERLGTSTVSELSAMPPAQLVRLGGIGAATRREINHLAQRIRDELPPHAASGEADTAAIDAIAAQLVPRPPADEDHRTAIASLLELTESPPCTWPTYREVVEDTGLERRTVDEAIGSARSRWTRRPDLTAVRRELAEALARRGGIVGGEELAGVLLTARGSTASEPIRSRRARAVVRAAAETELALQQPRFVPRRLGRSLLVALDGRVTTDDGDVREWSAERLLEAAALLGETAGVLAARVPLASPEQVIRELRDVGLPDDVGPFTDAQLVRLAAAAADQVGVSTRMELYPAGMAPERAIEEARATLLDGRGLSAQEIQRRVQARFPEAGRLPSPPALDGLLEPLGLSLREGRYVLPRRESILSSFASSAPRTTSFATPDERAAAIRALDERLETVAKSGGFLALTVARRRYAEAAARIARESGAVAIDFDMLLIGALRAKSDELGAQWEAFLKADARRGDRAWTRLGQLVDRTLPDVEREIREHAGTVVMTGLGLLARYERSGMLERLRSELTTTAAQGPLRGLILVVPGDDPTALPVVDGTPIPVFSANQWAHVPTAWLSERADGEAA